MALVTALIYWVIIALWLSILAAIGVAFVRNPRTFGTTRLLLAVLVIDTLRNIAENLYFGMYFGGQYGLLPASLVNTLGNPAYLIIPKIANVAAALTVLGLLIFRWLPLAEKERVEADAEIRNKTDAWRQEAEERQRLFDTSLDLILITDRHGFFTRVSPSSLATIGYRPEEMIGRSGTEFIHPDDLESTRAEMRLAQTGQNTRNFKCHYLHKNGHVVPLEWSGVWSEPEQRHFFFGRDMTEQQEAEARLWQAAYVDPLTNLPNYKSLQADMATLLPAAEKQYAIALIGIDGFKQIKDTLGSTIGDELLRRIAQRLNKNSNCAYRLNGDEFALIVQEHGDLLAVSRVAAGIIDSLTKPFNIERHQLFISANIGLATASVDGSEAGSLLADAGLALFDAKAAGDRRVRHFVPTMRAKAEARRALDNELRRASANGEFTLFFQPQIQAIDSRVVGAEALLRWHHPSNGILAPGAFIDALCASSVSLEVGRWTIMNACQTAALWRAKGLGNLRIAVNLFPLQVRQGTLLQDVVDALDTSGLPANLLELEITENIALDYDDKLLSTLNTLRDMGVSIAFDDFGTGYASLSYLTSFPLNRIKIDRKFVQKIDEDTQQNTAVVRSILMLARNLGLEVTAEGVETPAQATFLCSEHCQELQGFLYSKPIASDAFEEYLIGSTGDGRRNRA